MSKSFWSWFLLISIDTWSTFKFMSLDHPILAIHFSINCKNQKVNLIIEKLLSEKTFKCSSYVALFSKVRFTLIKNQSSVSAKDDVHNANSKTYLMNLNSHFVVPTWKNQSQHRQFRSYYLCFDVFTIFPSLESFLSNICYCNFHIMITVLLSWYSINFCTRQGINVCSLGT